MLPLAKVGSFSESANFLHEKIIRRGDFRSLQIYETTLFVPRYYFLPYLSPDFVLAPDEHLHSTLHFKRKKEARELTDGDIRLYSKDVYLFAVVL